MALLLGNHLGDSRLLSDGGLLQQPAGMFFAAQRARYLSFTYDKVSKEADLMKLDADELEIHKLIGQIQMEIASE